MLEEKEEKLSKNQAIKILDDSIVENAKEILSKDTSVISDFWIKKYKAEASKNWNNFYKRNTLFFFKVTDLLFGGFYDRHWTDREFPELLASGNDRKVLMEVGCGTGNFLFPLLELKSNLFIYACDFSEKAIELVKANPLYSTDRCCAFVADITSEDALKDIESESVDLVSMIFVLSAIPPEKLQSAVSQITRVLKPGGKILLRDYGIYDHAQLRFKPGHKLHSSCYVRQDGTLSYYFTIDEIQGLFLNTGLLTIEECGYIMKETINRKKELKVARIFIQAKAVKKKSLIPSLLSDSSTLHYPQTPI